MTTDHSEDVRGMVPVAYGVSSINAIDGSVGWDFIADFEQAAHDHINDHIMRLQDEGLEVDEMHVVPLYTHPADCPRCADFVEEIKFLKRQVYDLNVTKFRRFNNEDCWIYQGDGSDDLASLVCPVVISADKLAALEAENARISAELEEAILIHQTDTVTESAVAALQDTIAQQAERIKELVEQCRTNHSMEIDALALKCDEQAEQLAAAEKLLIECRSSVRLDWQNYERLLMNNNLTGSREAITDEAKRLHELLLAIDATIAAQKGEK